MKTYTNEEAKEVQKQKGLTPVYVLDDRECSASTYRQADGETEIYRSGLTMVYSKKTK